MTRNAVLLVLSGAIMLTLFAQFMRPTGIVAAIGVLTAVATIALISARRRPRRLELWANYRGQPARLFVSDDWWLFGGVERQLRRAITDARQGMAPGFNASYESNVPHPSTLHPSHMHPASVYARPVPFLPPQESPVSSHWEPAA